MKARTPQEILNSLLNRKATQTELNVLNNPSNVSIWYNLLGIFSVEGFIMESLMEQQLKDINSRAKEIPVGTILWYAVETLNYQHGDSLIVENGIPTYAVIDETKQVVKQSACVLQSGTVIVKAGKIDNATGDTIPLSALELQGLQEYWLNKRFAGVPLLVVSEFPDIMKVSIDIKVDTQKIALTGESQTDTGVFPVIDAIKDYYKNIDFGGKFLEVELVDAIQSVAGVQNVIVKEIFAKQNVATNFVDVLQDSEHSYLSFAGYLKEDSANPLSSTLNYFN